MFKLDLEKAEESEIKLPTSLDHRKSKRIPVKTSISASLTTLKPLTVWFKQSEKFFKRWEYQTTLLASCEVWMQVKKQQLELNMEQTGSKLKRSTSRLYIVTLLT